MARTTTVVTQLKNRLREGALEHARLHGHPYYESLNKNPDERVVMFYSHSGGTRHGNFIDVSFQAIVADRNWRERLNKPHTVRRRSLPEPWSTTAKETDSSHSSDALLMNVFCYPGILATESIARLLELNAPKTPVFGYSPGVPKVSGPDSTEVDMKLDDLLVEAKLTEANRPEPHDIDKYVTYRDVFASNALDDLPNTYIGFQLIRNVLAARATGCRFVVLHDASRTDLDAVWRVVHAAMRPQDLASRCSSLTWQQVAASAPEEVRKFLAAKYGIA